MKDGELRGQDTSSSGMRRCAVAILAVSLLASLSASAACAADLTPKEYQQLFERPPLKDGSGSIFLAPACAKRRCVAVADIEAAFEAMGRRDRPNGMTWLNGPPPPEVLDRRADQAIARHILSHPARMPAYCAILAGLAATSPDYHTVFLSIELANRITRPGLDCIATVLAALPISAETDDVVRQSQLACVAEKRANCGRIFRLPRVPPFDSAARP